MHCKTLKFFGLVEMTSGLVHLGYSLPEGQAGRAGWKGRLEGQAGKLNFFLL